MTLDAEVAALLEALNSGFPKVEEMTGARARAAIRARLRPPAAPVPVGRWEDRLIPGPDGAIRIRIYRPAAASDTPLPIVVFAHGGGFVFCDLDTHDDLCRRMTNGVGAVVISVDYRLAPEHPWPAAVTDVYAATAWAAVHATEVGGDATRVAVAGDSAGGNLAAVATTLARDRSGPNVCAQLLLYPVIAADFETESYRTFETGFYNTRAAMCWYWDQYLPDLANRAHPTASPLRAELAGLPPAVVVTATYDPLASESTAYVNALRAAGISVVHRTYAAVHGFMSMSALTVAAAAQEQAWADLGELLQP
ncbi:alpha/beta hydrolase [Antrihabitans sp. YC3-6]|uniref:Alpha/beta hydrolase n=1 Tax=Antrihabitans stalagmiti TaxID=2799499 RepID=A0A934U191_9NOCA|nr:alpha/beta hydrolase [Antrihabitans stalagmiti]MBJ8338130.1 alpha/beta hydrolase [Antrihabitans stalagmiti]